VSHAYAPLTVEGRRRMCLRVDAGRPRAHVAAEAGVPQVPVEVACPLDRYPPPARAGTAPPAPGYPFPTSTEMPDRKLPSALTVRSAGTAERRVRSGQGGDRATPRADRFRPAQTRIAAGAYYPTAAFGDEPTAPDPNLLDRFADHLTEIITTGTPNQRRRWSPAHENRDRTPLNQRIRPRTGRYAR
jgi:hypothetical protein